jgi:ATP-binding cassette subfamily B (MDR/TAP) protein 1
LRGINLTIENGQKIALVGSSGCGKSTITQLLERFYDPNVGQVTLGNRDLKQYNLQWLRSQIGIIKYYSLAFRDSFHLYFD